LLPVWIAQSPLLIPSALIALTHIAIVLRGAVSRFVPPLFVPVLLIPALLVPSLLIPLPVIVPVVALAITLLVIRHASVISLPERVLAVKWPPVFFVPALPWLIPSAVVVAVAVSSPVAGRLFPSGVVSLLTESSAHVFTFLKMINN
jgi:hypothetical protein